VEAHRASINNLLGSVAIIQRALKGDATDAKGAEVDDDLRDELGSMGIDPSSLPDDLALDNQE
jgi:hypothetical protein